VTLGPTGKAARQIVREIQGFLARNGYKPIHTGRSAKALSPFAQVIDVFRDGQSPALAIRYGISFYNTDCNHLHYAINGDGTRFAIAEGTGQATESVVQSTRYFESDVFRDFERFSCENYLLHEGNFIFPDHARQLVPRTMTGPKDDALMARDAAYWRGETKAIRDPAWPLGLCVDTR